MAGPKKFFKKRTKRTTTRERVKQVKKLSEHAAKVRKEKKKNPEKFQKKSAKKQWKIPADCPFKDDILQEAADVKVRQQQIKEKRKVEQKERRDASRAAALEAKRTGGLEALVADAQVKQNQHENAKSFVQSSASHGVTDRSAKAYYREFMKVVEAADVILEVLDARDPMGTRCKEVEEAVLNAQGRKRLVMVLNKADLVPKENLEQWLKYLRGQLPAIAFKASTQNQGTKLGQSNLSVKQSTDSQMQTSKCVGARTLTALLANYSRNRDIKTAIRVGVVGLPNVGKSSLINSLKRSRACGVGAVPGFTRVMQEVQLDSKVKLLDSPGMVLASGNMTDASVALRNAVRVDALDDPVTPVQAILQRCPKQQVMLQYNVSDFNGTGEFLSLLARGIGKLKKGGIPDQLMAARLVLNDWNSGKIKYFTHPPENPNESVSEISAEIVTEYAKEFELADLDKMDAEDIDSLPTVLPSQTMLLPSSGVLDQAQKGSSQGGESMEDEEEDDASEEENEGQLSNKISIASTTGKTKSSSSEEKLPRFQAQGLMKLKKANKLREKKERKERKRRDKLSDELSNNMEAAFEGI